MHKSPALHQVFMIHKRPVSAPRDLSMPVYVDGRGTVGVLQFFGQSWLWFIILIVAVLVSGVLIWKLFSGPSRGEVLLQEVIAAAGGRERWLQVEEGSFTSTRTFYDESGSIANTLSAKSYFRRGNEGFKLLTETSTGEGFAVVGFDGREVWATLDGVPVSNQRIAGAFGIADDVLVLRLALRSSLMRFTIFQDLMEYDVVPEYAGTKVHDGELLETIEITFLPKVVEDRWVLSVNHRNKLISFSQHDLGSDVDTAPVEIHWSDYRLEDGMLLSHRSSLYRSNGAKVMEETVSHVDFHLPAPEEWFDQPEMP